jgi:hypothetical protein
MINTTTIKALGKQIGRSGEDLTLYIWNMIQGYVPTTDKKTAMIIKKMGLKAWNSKTGKNW